MKKYLFISIQLILSVYSTAQNFDQADTRKNLSTQNELTPKVNSVHEESFQRGMYEVRGNRFAYCDSAGTHFFNQRIQHTILPSGQVRTLKFLVELENIGSSSVSGAKMIVEVRDLNSNLIFSDSSAGANLNVTTRLDSVIWAGLSTTVDVYNVILKIDYDSIALDSDVSNNIDTLRLEVSTNTNGYFARDNNTFSALTAFENQGNQYMIGQYFKATSNMTITGLDIAFSTFTEAGAEICIAINEFDSLLNGTVILNDCDNFIYHTVQPSDIPSSSIVWKHVPFSVPVQLQAGKQYFPYMATGTTWEMAYVMLGGETYAGEATVFIFDATDATWYYIHEIPMIRMSYSPTVSTGEMSEQNIFSVYPNPASDIITIANLVSENQVQIFDAAGREMENIKYLGENSFDIRHLPAGWYALRIIQKDKTGFIPLIKE